MRVVDSRGLADIGAVAREARERGVVEDQSSIRRSVSSSSLKPSREKNLMPLS